MPDAHPVERQAALVKWCTEQEVLPGVRLFVAAEPVALWEATESFSGTREEPPFWGHAWPGGIAVSEWLVAHPELVAGQHVLDFAAGGGLAGVVAARCGAARVTASELDAWAVAAIEANAALNGVAIDATARDVIGADEAWDVVLVGDVFYERELSTRVLGWLRTLKQRGASVLIGDPGRSFLPSGELEVVFESNVKADPRWDSVLDRRARVWTLR